MKDLIACVGNRTLTDRWANSKVGIFEDYDNSYLYRFREANSTREHYVEREEENKQGPVIFCGFVAWLMKHWGNDTVQIFESYINTRLAEYKNTHNTAPDALKRDLCAEFYNQHEEQEKPLVKQSEALYEYLTDTDVKTIKQYIENYFEYVQSKVTTTTKNKSKSPQQKNELPKIPDDILIKLENEKLITQNPLRWLGTNALCAYFVDCYFSKSNPNNYWKIGEALFNAKNLRQSKDGYENSKNGVPRNSAIIDEILQLKK